LLLEASGRDDDGDAYDCVSSAAGVSRVVTETLA
jgi:hypothetical protein